MLRCLRKDISSRCNLNSHMSHVTFRILRNCVLLRKIQISEFYPLRRSARNNKNDLSGNIVCPQASAFQNITRLDHFWQF